MEVYELDAQRKYELTWSIVNPPATIIAPIIGAATATIFQKLVL